MKRLCFYLQMALLSPAVACGAGEAVADESATVAGWHRISDEMASESQRKEFGPFPMWSVAEGGFRWYLLSAKYMDDVESRVRDCNVSVVSAFYHRKEDGCYKIKFSVRKRKSKAGPWEEVDHLEICGFPHNGNLQGFKIHATTPSDIKVLVRVRIGVRRYFSVDVRNGEWCNEISAEMLS